jgi:N-dimethylarginine dimethylaminohydrolase
MEGNSGRVDFPLAMQQWNAYADEIRQVADLEVLENDPELPDQVFTANIGIVVGNRVVLANFAHDERKREAEHAATWFRDNGFDVYNIPDHLYFEGTGDALQDRGQPLLWAGYGYRTSLETHRYLADLLDIEVVSLRLADPRFYHLDVCLSPLPDGSVMYYPGAFDADSVKALEERLPEDKRLVVSEHDALRMACNCVAVADRVFLHEASDELEQELAKRGLKTVRIDMSQFHLAGGSTRCMVLSVNEPRLQPAQAKTTITQQTFQVSGHLLSQNLMDQMLDTVNDHGCSCDILAFRPGMRKEDTSRVEMRVVCPRQSIMDTVESALLRFQSKDETTEVLLPMEAMVSSAAASPSLSS